MTAPKVCRHCGESFVPPQPPAKIFGRYINECRDCAETIYHDQSPLRPQAEDHPKVKPTRRKIALSMEGNKEMTENIRAARKEPLRRWLIDFVKSKKENSKLTRKACIDKWEAAYRDRRPIAADMLKRAREHVEVSNHISF